MKTTKQDDSAACAVEVSQLTAGRTRIRDGDGFIGTIVYLGPVASAKNTTEIYAGVLWDDPTRGKHDGSVICRATKDLIRYFSAPPFGGSFLRLRKIDLGVSLTQDLIQDRYVEMNAPLIAPNNMLPHTARTASGKPKDIELLGELKIRQKQQMEALPKISLRNLGIARLGTGEGPLAEVGHIQEVDLAGNLLTEWDTIWRITQSFPSLQVLSLASNKLHNIDNPIQQTYHQIHTLNLHDCSITNMETLKSLDHSCPNMRELCLASNDLSFLASNEIIGFHQLRNFDCSDCHLTNWRPFRNLPCLETLHLDCNTSLKLEPLLLENSFSSLKSLSLSETFVETWPELDALLPLPALLSLKFRKTLLTSTMGAAEARYLTIARLPALQVLNSTTISKKERIDAERRYVSYVAREVVWKETRDVINDHPQYQRLLEQHSDMASLGVHDNSLRFTAQAINVTIRSMAAASCSMDALHRRMPSTLIIGRVKALCARAFGLDVDLQILHLSEKGAAFPIALDDDDHTLAYFGVNDGSEILMNEVDVEAQRREEFQRRELYERQIKEQEDDIQRRKEYQRNQ